MVVVVVLVVVVLVVVGNHDTDIDTTDSSVQEWHQTSNMDWDRVTNDTTTNTDRQLCQGVTPDPHGVEWNRVTTDVTSGTGLCLCSGKTHDLQGML